MRLRGLLTAGERLRKAHEELLVGGSPEALQQGRDGERRAIAELTGAARALLEDAGHPASEATLERVSETLHAAVVDEGLGGRVREGRLDKEEQVTGFGFGNLQAVPSPEAGGARDPQPDAEDEAGSIGARETSRGAEGSRARSGAEEAPPG